MDDLKFGKRDEGRTDSIERQNLIRDNDAYSNYLNKENRKSYEEFEREYRQKKMSRIHNDDDYCNAEDDEEDNEEEIYEEEYCGASNKEVFSSVAIVFVPVLVCCMMVSLFSNSKDNKQQSNIIPKEVQESTETKNESIDNGESFIEEQKTNGKEFLEKIKNKIKEDFDINWSDILIDH